MYKYTQTYITKVVILLIAFQVLNLSVYGGDFSRNILLRNTSSIGMYNQVDSFGEYVLEVICNVKDKDAFPDNDLHNHSKSHVANLKYVDIKLPVPFPLLRKVAFTTIAVNHSYPLYITYDYLFVQKITPPPPKSMA